MVNYIIFINWIRGLMDYNKSHIDMMVLLHQDVAVVVVPQYQHFSR